MKKIRNIDKSVCCGEQMIAYNYCCSLGELCESADELIKKFFGDGQKGFDNELVKKAIRNGFPEYKKKPVICTSYEQVGKIFCL